MNDQPTEKPSWWQRLSGGLKRTSASIGGAVADLVVKRKLDQEMLDQIEEVLIRADLGVDTAARIAAAVGEGRYDKSITSDEVKAVVAAEVEKVLTPVALPLAVDGEKPFVILVVGVNGSGKTTTVGKLAAKFHAEGRSVMLAAGDTFRAAAIDQLNIWGGRSGATVIARAPGADAAGLAFDALMQARVEEIDVLLVDTAGRLQNKAVLMDELEKIVRVMKKVDRRCRMPFSGPRRHGGAERALPGRGVSRHRRCHRAGHDQARWHRARRHPGRHRGEIRPAGAFHRRGRKH
jgi:Signal recognition particle GTPase